MRCACWSCAASLPGVVLRSWSAHSDSLVEGVRDRGGETACVGRMDGQPQNQDPLLPLAHGIVPPTMPLPLLEYLSAKTSAKTGTARNQQRPDKVTARPGQPSNWGGLAEDRADSYTGA